MLSWGCTLGLEWTGVFKIKDLVRDGNCDSVLSLENGEGTAEFIVLKSWVRDDHLYDFDFPKWSGANYEEIVPDN